MSASFFSGDKRHPDTSEFLCGVVEGFYGRPWTYPQRRELFRRMQSMGMNAYLYAPKDDMKHRHSWRELYTEKEEESMRSLIAAAEEHNVLFIFALSPGSDVVYSQEEDVSFLKSKLQQAARLGCRAYALLFDDIDTRLCPADQEIFGSPGRAQVALTNEIYQALGCPETFLFCPTEYCASRAVPNVAKSTYLATLGSDLAQGINILWTGPIVVSKTIPTLGIRDLARLLKRSIVLWDNLHANDYDQRRVFLGPYCGRPLALRRRKLIQGVLTNPNCEFEANFVALHTLAQWARFADPSSADSVPVSADLADIGDDLEKEKNESSGDLQPNKKNEMDTADGSDSKRSPPPQPKVPIYKPRQALLNALRDWLALMNQDQGVANSSKTPCDLSSSPMDTDSAEPPENAMQVEPSLSASDNESKCSTEATTNADLSSCVELNLADLELLADLFYLPFNHGPSALKIMELGHWLREHAFSAPHQSYTHPESEEWCKKYAELMKMVARVNQLREKVQRLPHPGVVYDLTPYLTEINAVLAMVLDYFRWLESGVMSYRTFGHLRRLLTWFSPGYSEMAMSGEHEPWMFRGGLITEIQRILPLESAQDLFPAPSRVGPLLTTTPVAVMPPPQPGSVACTFPIPPPPPPPQPTDPPECKRLLEQTPDQRPAYFQPRRPYLVRPYRPDDKPKLYSLWRRLLLRRIGLSADALPEEYKDLPGDRYLLSYLEHSPQHCLVVEGPPLYFIPPMENQISSPSQPKLESSEWDIVGFALAAPDVAAWARDREELCRTYLREKYPKLNQARSTLGEPASILQLQRKPSISGGLSLSTEDLIALCTEWFHNERVPKTTSAIAEAAINNELPEPLGAGINDQAMAVEVESVRSFSDDLPKPEERLKEGESQPLTSSDAPVDESNSTVDPSLEHADASSERKGSLLDQASMDSPVLPPAQPPSVSESGTSAPSVAAGPAELIAPNPLTEGCSSGRPVVSGQMEAIHSALIAHPATIFVELDDCDFGNQPGVPTPLMMMNHHMGLAFDPPELVLDEVARRLFVCLLAGLKTWACNGVHVELDTINEPRADLYRRFGFYPVAAASTDFTSVLARLI